MKEGNKMDYSNFIPWGISFISLLIAGASFLRNGKKESKKEIKKEESRFDGIKESILKANMKLDQVCSVTNETRLDIKSLNKDLGDIDRRVTITERDMKTVFTIIDELKGRVNEL